MEEEYNSGLTEASTKDTEATTKRMGKEDSFIRTETSMKDSFLKIKRTERGFIVIWMERSMLGSEGTTKRMEMEWKPGLMAPAMKGSMRMG